MSINKISGNILQDNLLRGANLAIQTDLIFFDIINNRIGVNTATPTVDLTVNGNIYSNVYTGNTVSVIGNVTGGNINTTGLVSVTGNVISGNVNTVQVSASGNVSAGNLISQSVITTPGNVVAGNIIVGSKLIPTTGNINVANVNIVNVSNPVANSDAATKGYVDGSVGNVTITISDSSNTQSVGNGGTITFAATANQTTVVVGSVDTVTFGIPASISVNELTSRSTGNITFTPDSTGFTIATGTTGLVVPVGNTTQRPSGPPIGTIRFNTNSSDIELWDGSTWSAIGGPVTSITNQYITGDGSTVTFALDQSSSAAAVIVSTNGVVQFPDVAYTVTGNSITFAEAPALTDIIDIRFTAHLTTISSLTNASGKELIINPSGVVNITNTQSIQLPSYTVTQANALGNVAAGQVIYVSNGDSGNPCLAVYSSGSWKRVSLGATIST